MNDIKEKVLARSNLHNSSDQAPEEITGLKEEFAKIRSRLLKGEKYINEHPHNEKAVKEFRKLLNRTAKINKELIEKGEDPLGR